MNFNKKSKRKTCMQSKRQTLRAKEMLIEQVTGSQIGYNLIEQETYSYSKRQAHRAIDTRQPYIARDRPKEHEIDSQSMRQGQRTGDGIKE